MTNNEDKIRKGVAVLEVLQMVDPLAIIAGGAPRDLLYGKDIKDIDIYMRAPLHNTKDLIQLLKKVTDGDKFINMTRTYISDTESEEDVHYVLEGSIAGVMFNVIILQDETPVNYVNNHFDINLCIEWIRNKDDMERILAGTTMLTPHIEINSNWSEERLQAVVQDAGFRTHLDRIVAKYPTTPVGPRLANAIHRRVPPPIPAPARYGTSSIVASALSIFK